MSLDTYFKITSYAMVATAFVGLGLTGEVDALALALYSLAFSASLYADIRGITRLRLREWMWRVLAAAYVPFIFLDAAVLSRSRILALVHMSLFLSAAKLYQNKRDRDWVFLYLIALFQMLMSAGLTFNTSFIASLGLFIFFFISTLAAFEIRRARREVAAIDEEMVTRLKPVKPVRHRAKEKQGGGVVNRVGRVRYLLGASAAQVAMVAVLTLPFFFLIPRFGGGSHGRGLASGEALTGFSDNVKLGQVASIKKSQRIAMRVQLSRKPNRYLRWRGIALEHYEGRTWSTTLRPQQETRGIRVSGDNVADADNFERSFLLGKATQDGSNIIEQKITIEPRQILTLFAAQKPLRLQGPIPAIVKRGYGPDMLDDLTSLSAISVRGRLTYSVWSDIAMPREEDLRAEPIAYPVKKVNPVYTALPNIDSRIAGLAREITRGASTPYDKARAVENYLKTRFDYSLELEPTEGDPLAHFLFNVREGHCEYFATAMAVMLRTLDIPARIVNGFQMGEYNDINDLYTVRDSDAHSWVEAYFPQTGSWVEFDPTPPAGINSYSQGGLMARVRKYLEAAEVFWLDYIVTLDSEEQASIMVDLQHRLLSIKDYLVGYYVAAKMWVKGVTNRLVVERRWSAGDILKLGGLMAFLAAVVMGLYITSAHLKRRSLAPTGYGPWWHKLFILPNWRRSRLARRNPRASAVLFYEQMLAIAARAGMIKAADQTPLEFAAASGLEQVREITAVYNRVRFGGAHLDDGETRRVSTLLADLKRAVAIEGSKRKGKS